MRSVFSSGVLDGFLEKQFNPFDFYIGVSAGAVNLATYMAGTPGESLEIYLRYALHKRFISFPRFLRGGHLLDLDWLFEETLAETHLDLAAVYNHGKPLYVCVTDVDTGQAVYINTNIDNLRQTIKASAALPLLYRKFPLIDGRPMTDGGVADGIPVAKAIELGAKRIMVIRSRHKHYLKKDTLGHQFIRWKLKHHPTLVAVMRERVKRHTDVIRLIRNPPDDVQIVEVCPPDNFLTGRFSRNRKLLQEGYESGVNLVEEVTQQWNSLA